MTSSRLRFILIAVLAFAGLVATGAVSAQRGDPQGGSGQGSGQGGYGQGGDQRGMGGFGITLFSDANFHGPNANFRIDVPDLRKYNMNDRVDGLQIARGETWEVCVDINYGGRCQVFSGDEGDLNRLGWGGLISSFRKVQAQAYGQGRGQDNGGRGYGYGRGETQPYPPVRNRLVLYDAVWFGGRSLAVMDMTPALRGYGNRARSVKVYGGAWELCDGDQFRGHCATVTDSVPDLARIGLQYRISSARPVGRGR
jgi:hypothetical protein